MTVAAEGIEMLRYLLAAEFVTPLGILVGLLWIPVLWYYWYVYRPYAKFRSFRLETRIPFWILKRKNLNNVMIQTILDVAKRYQSDEMFVLWIGLPYLCVFGEEIVKLIVSEPGNIDKPRLYELFEIGLGKGLLTSNGESWRKQRKLVNPAFHVLALKEQMPVMNENADALVKQLSTLKGEPTDEIIDMLCECTLKIVYESTTGKKIIKVDRLVEVAQSIIEFVLYRFWCPWLYFDFMLHFFPGGRKALRLIEEGQKVTKEEIEERKELLKARHLSLNCENSDADTQSYRRKAKSFGEILLDQHLQDPSFSMKELIYQINTLVAGAFDTTAHALMWTLFLLGLHQDIQERAYDEVMAETDGDVQYKVLPNLIYLDSVIKEVLRLYPAIPAFGRLISKDIQFGNSIIPKNTSVFILSYIVHRNPEIYPDPEKFDPERFLAKDSKIKSWNYIPFAEGSRSCIGKNYAIMEIKIILAHILRNFKIISLDRREDVEISFAVVLGSAKKLRMQFIPRHSSSTSDN